MMKTEGLQRLIDGLNRPRWEAQTTTFRLTCGYGSHEKITVSCVECFEGFKQVNVVSRR